MKSLHARAPPVDGHQRGYASAQTATIGLARPLVRETAPVPKSDRPWAKRSERRAGLRRTCPPPLGEAEGVACALQTVSPSRGRTSVGLTTPCLPNGNLLKHAACHSCCAGWPSLASAGTGSSSTSGPDLVSR